MEFANQPVQPYPMDERQWLLATSYNTGAECLQSASLGFVAVSGITSSSMSDSASMLDEAKRWFEASTVICRFVPDGKDRAEKVRIVHLSTFGTCLNCC
jgi:hypothetical protein